MELFKPIETHSQSLPVYTESNELRILGISFLEKKVRIAFGNLRLFRIIIFKNRSFSSGQGVVQIEPNLVSSIPWVTRV